MVIRKVINLIRVFTIISIGIGGDPIIGTTTKEALEMLKAVVEWSCVQRLILKK